MKRGIWLIGLASLLAASCTLPETKVVDELPDPVVSQTSGPKLTPTPMKTTRLYSYTPQRHAPAPYMPPPAPAPAPRYVDAGEPGWIPPGGVSSRWTTIVIHHSASEDDNAASMDKLHRNKGWDELGYHFVIGNGSKSGDGQIEVGSRWTKQKHGAHAKTPDNYYNEHGIGICLVGNFQNHGPSAAQLRSLDRLVRFLMTQTGVGPTAIMGHREVKSTLCPGRLFPIDRFRMTMASATGDTSRQSYANAR